MYYSTRLTERKTEYKSHVETFIMIAYIINTIAVDMVLDMKTVIYIWFDSKWILKGFSFFFKAKSILATLFPSQFFRRQV